MTHDERVKHHMYETLEGIAEHSERIASLEELALDMWAAIKTNERVDSATLLLFGERLRKIGVIR